MKKHFTHATGFNHKAEGTCPHCGEIHTGRSVFSDKAAEENLQNKIYDCGSKRQQRGLPIAAGVGE